MQVLIIGGTGLISTAITRELIARGDDVTLYNYTIPFVEGVRRIVDWLDARGRIHDRDEPEVYSEIIVRWQHFSTKETFFKRTDNATA